MESNQTTQYDREFKIKAIELAEQIGHRAACDKLGLKSHQTIGAWKRWLKPSNKVQEEISLEQAKAQIKRLKKELEEEKQVVTILKYAAAFFSQDQLKKSLK